MQDLDERDGGEAVAYDSLYRLDGRGVVVVGAGNGMGAESAAIAAALGARVLCVDVDAERAAAVADEVGGSACVADVTGEDGVSHVLDTAVREFGRVDGLVDIVGLSGFGRLPACTDVDLRDQFRINFDHAFRLLRAVPRVMSPEGACVFVASSLGLTGAAGQSLYSAAKAALISLVRSCALEYAPIRCNAVAPGVIGTPRVGGYLSRAGALDVFASNSPQGRIG